MTSASSAVRTRIVLRLRASGTPRISKSPAVSASASGSVVVPRALLTSAWTVASAIGPLPLTAVSVAGVGEAGAVSSGA